MCIFTCNIVMENILKWLFILTLSARRLLLDKIRSQIFCSDISPIYVHIKTLQAAFIIK